MNSNDDVEILLAEDSPHDAEMTMRVLKDHNLSSKLHWVRDGVEVLDFIRCIGQYADRDRSKMPKVLLLDLKMPRLDGLAVLRELKSDEETRAMPIVVMTSSSQERDLVESYRLGVNAYVVKPVDFEGFTEAVSRLGLFWLLVNRIV